MQQELLWSADGVYGPATKQAVLRYQRQNRLPATGQADVAAQKSLGMAAFE